MSATVPETDRLANEADFFNSLLDQRGVWLANPRRKITGKVIGPYSRQIGSLGLMKSGESAGTLAVTPAETT